MALLAVLFVRPVRTRSKASPSWAGHWIDISRIGLWNWLFCIRPLRLQTTYQVFSTMFAEVHNLYTKCWTTPQIWKSSSIQIRMLGQSGSFGRSSKSPLSCARHLKVHSSLKEAITICRWVSSRKDPRSADRLHKSPLQRLSPLTRTKKRLLGWGARYWCSLKQPSK